MPRILPNLNDIPDVAGKFVLVRASLNVPLHEGKVSNQFRIVRALPTINFLRERGAKVVIIAHIGRQVADTLAPVHDALQAYLPITFIPHTVGPEVEAARQQMKNGDVLLLENVRQDERETANDPVFSVSLAALGDYYVNDAFAASHRAHASIAGVPALLPSYFGRNFMHEYEELEKARTPQTPAIFILGGAKFETKMPLVQLFLEHYDHVFIGGALANDMFKAKGFEVGKSLVSDVDLSDAPLLHNEKILLPIDVVVDGPAGQRTCAPEEVTTEEVIYDAGPETITMLAKYVNEANTILWNGPLGNFEGGYGTHTLALAKQVAEATGYAIVGGGDTVAAIEELACQEKFGFMSTAGGAMLTYLEEGSLPAIDAVLHKE